jgi:hypothetical protein
MYTLHRILSMILIIAASPVRMLAALPAAIHVPAANAQSAPAIDVPCNLDLSNPQGVVVTIPDTPNFDTEVLQPLRAQQAAEAAAEAAKAAAAKPKIVLAHQVIGPVTGDVWYRLRLCESGNDYAKNTGNGYYGAYQYDISTWNNYGGYSRPDLAPASVQDAKAQADQARRGWSPWPACARKLGLM